MYYSILDAGNSSSLTKLKTSEQKKEALFDAAKKGILGDFFVGRRVDRESINDFVRFSGIIQTRTVRIYGSDCSFSVMSVDFILPSKREFKLFSNVYG